MPPCWLVVVELIVTVPAIVPVPPRMPPVPTAPEPPAPLPPPSPKTLTAPEPVAEPLLPFMASSTATGGLHAVLTMLVMPNRYWRCSAEPPPRYSQSARQCRCRRSLTTVNPPTI